MKASGLNVLRVIDSSTAASLACCLNNIFNSDDKEDENILIFDLGLVLLIFLYQLFLNKKLKYLL